MARESADYGPYSREFAEAIADLYGEEWVQDQIARTEDPTYLSQRLGKLISAAIDIRGLSVLDYGCGPGASSVIIGRMGGRVTGIDPDAKSIRAAKLRARDLGMEEVLQFHHVPDTRLLPFADESFDIVLCNGTMEHIKIRERRDCVREMFRVLRSGGFLFICNSPNRWWPIDSHTTHLPFVPYMPLKLARRFAIMLGKVKPEMTIEDLLDLGIRGISYHQIARWIGPGRFVNLRLPGEVDRIFEASMQFKFDTPRRRLLKRLVKPLISTIDMLILRPLNLPASLITPYLSICLRKL